MGRKNRKSRSLGYDTAEPCQEPIAHVKERVRRAKKNIKTIIRLSREDVLDYDMKNEALGKAYFNLLYAKEELARRKARKKAQK